jgi:hypothetical protein
MSSHQGASESSSKLEREAASLERNTLEIRLERCPNYAGQMAAPHPALLPLKRVNVLPPGISIASQMVASAVRAGPSDDPYAVARLRWRLSQAGLIARAEEDTHQAEDHEAL